MEGILSRENKTDERTCSGLLTQWEWLGRIFQWEPRWLNDDEYHNTSPSIVDPNDLHPTMLSYETYDDYSKIMIPLLTHEFWYAMKNEFNNESDRKTIKGIVNENSFQYSSCDNSKTNSTIFYFDLKIKLHSTKLSDKSYPLRNDLVKFKDPNKSVELFAYIEELSYRRLENERVEIIYTLATRPILMKFSACTLEITTVISMSSYLTLINSLQYLPNSLLHKLILHPNIEGYELCALDDTNFPPFLLTEDNLNSVQLQVVARIIKTVEEQKPNVCLIRGPPGTGKSLVIVNTVASLITAKSVRTILVCAHSNQAIDELVLRLLEIQKIFYANGLNLNIVRVGQEDKMHERVKKISTSALAHEALANLGVSVTSEKLYNKEQKILEEADVIASTLTSCCNNQMTNVFGLNKLSIPVCLVDEAAQGMELATIAPLMLGVTNLILVGDPQQLRPTVISTKAAELGLDVSLFARAEKIFNVSQLGKNPIVTLNIQYRMVDAIAQWPNRYFYHGLLRNATNARSLCFPQYKLLNHSACQDASNYSNICEANLVVNVVYTMMTQSNIEELNSIVNLGIITPYKKQRELIIQLLKTQLADVPEQIQSRIKVTNINTVDSFQGSERDIIIMSCVRSTGIGFVSDSHRLCVSLTRAKYCLIICGNFNAFNRNVIWRSLLNDAKSRNAFVNIDHNANVNELKKHVIVDNVNSKK